ncbi:MAG: hypothetical protein ACLSUS_05605 [Opitutales bacterium]
MAKKVQDWKVYYNNYYKRSYELFIDYFQYVQKAYKNMPLKEKADFWKKYYYFTQKTLRIFTYLFFCNGVCVKNFKITLLYILNFEITQSGQELFYLVNELNSLKNSKFLITDQSQEQLLALQYINIFKQLNLFLEKRQKYEALYGF